MSKERLEVIREALNAESVSLDQLVELGSLVDSVEPGDVQLLEAAGVPENISTNRAESLDVFTLAAFEALFWSEGADKIGVDDLDQADFDEFVEDCKGFQADFGHLFGNRTCFDRGGDLEAAGHLFALTRNRHGAGFWDGDYEPEAGRALTEGAHVYGTFGILVDEETGEFCCHR